MSDFSFVVRLPLDKREALERLFYWNPQQQVFLSPIQSAVDQFGSPSIRVQDGEIDLSLPKLVQAQCLFAVTPSAGIPMAAILFHRDHGKDLKIVHMASLPNPSGQQYAAAALLKKVITVARSIRGVEVIHLPYGRGRIRVLR